VVKEDYFSTNQNRKMAFSGRLINLKTLLKNNLQAFDQEAVLNTVNIDSKSFEDEMFIGSVFCSDLSGSLKVSIHNKQKQDLIVLNKRFGIATNHE